MPELRKSLTKILAIDTSGPEGLYLAIQLGSSKKHPLPKVFTAENFETYLRKNRVQVKAQIKAPSGVPHSETILPCIRKVIQSARWKLPQIGVFAVAQGPGSFTGLRVSAITAMSLAECFAEQSKAQKRLLLPLPSLEIAARSWESSEAKYNPSQKPLGYIEFLEPASLGEAYGIKVKLPLSAKRPLASAKIVSVEKNPNKGEQKWLPRTFEGLLQTVLIHLEKTKKIPAQKFRPIYLREPDAVLRKNQNPFSKSPQLPEKPKA